MSSINILKSADKPFTTYRIAPATINITDLRLRTFIGFNEEELKKQQDIIVNAQLSYKAEDASIFDDEERALNYKLLCKSMIAHVEQGHFRLLEKLVADLLDILMSDERVLSANVRVDKPHALRFADSVSVTLSADRDHH
jgi:D-erythro-7,8-dihydroneopterin triphosphate epimerase